MFSVFFRFSWLPRLSWFSVPVLLVASCAALVSGLACALARVAGYAWLPALLSGTVAGAATLSVLSRLLDDHCDGD